MKNNHTGEFYQILDVINTEGDQKEEDQGTQLTKSSSIGDESFAELFKETKFRFGSSLGSGLLS